MNYSPYRILFTGILDAILSAVPLEPSLRHASAYHKVAHQTRDTYSQK